MTLSAILASIIFVIILSLTEAEAGYSQSGTWGVMEIPIEQVIDTIERETTTTEIVVENSGTEIDPYKDLETTTTEQITTTTIIPTTTTVIQTTTVPTTIINNSFLDCVKHRESRGDYTAVNSSSGAGGAYQFLQSTWNNTATHIGRNDLVGVHPSSVDPATQDMMANALLNWQGTSPWAYPASPC